LKAPLTGIMRAKLTLRLGLIATGGISLALFPTSPSEAAVHFQILKCFPSPSPWGEPDGALIIGTDGVLYGTTFRDGSYGLGSVFRVNKDGSSYAILHSFSYLDSVHPAAGLLEGSDGALYGTSTGDVGATGAVFKLKKDGGGFAILHGFRTVEDGAFPLCQLIEGRDGALYGTTAEGGPNGGGTAFKLNKDGTGYGLLHGFGMGIDGWAPSHGLVEGEGGALYGTTSGGGSIITNLQSGGGTVFKLNEDGSGYSVLHSFGTKLDGSEPECALIEDNLGTLYGTTVEGGANSCGTAFMLNTDGSGYQVLHDFGSDHDGCNPFAGLLNLGGGNLYGTTSGGGTNLLGSIFKLRSDGTGYSVVHSFVGGDGDSPSAGLVQDSDGALYGTTLRGGGISNNGVVFKLESARAIYTVLHEFPVRGAERWGPSGVIRGSDGALYGTTSGVAAFADDGGTVFKLNQDGSGYAVLRTFELDNAPSKLVEGSDGLLYSRASGGGIDGFGSIFKLNKDGGGFSVLHPFSNGDNATSGVAEARDGALYGTACCLYTGTPGIDNAYAYKLNRDGSGFSVLHMFEDLPNGSTANWLTAASDGALYGTTESGLGITLGRVFKLQPDSGNYQVLHDFGPTTNLNGWPGLGPLIEGSDGALYGTTAWSGYSDNSSATVFRLNKDGSGFETLLRPGQLPCTCFPPEEFPDLSPLVEARDGFIYGVMNYYFPDFGKVFRMKKDGSGYEELFSSFEEFVGQDFRPISGLVQGSDGAFYGTTSWGGLGGGGTVFKLWPPETPEISLTGASGSAGVEVSVTGVGGASYQLLRSSDLKTWTLLNTFSMPAAGVYNYPAASPNSAVFFRAVWIP
jgi:uncharacterized repeat protein (TIGR03803 family)